MLLKIFKGTGPGVIFLILLTLGLLWISAFLHPQQVSLPVYEAKPMPLYALMRQIIGLKPLGSLLSTLVLLGLMLFLISNFNTTIFFINERTFLPVLFYVLLSAVFPQNQTINPALPAAVFMILALLRIMDAYRKQGIAYNFFDAGIFIGIGSLFYANLIWFGIVIFAGIVLLRTVNIKEIAVSLLGLLTPYVIIIGFFYVTDRNIGMFLSDINENIFGNTHSFLFDRYTVLVLIYIALMLLISITFLFSRLNIKKIKSRKTFYLLLWVFAVSLLLYFFIPAVSVEMMWIAGIPASYFLAHYFVFLKQKILPEIFFTVFCLLILLLQVLIIF